MLVGNAIPGREYPVGEEFDIVVDPFWAQQGETRQLERVRVHSHDNGVLLLEQIGEPWDDPRPGHKHCRSCTCFNEEGIANP